MFGSIAPKYFSSEQRLTTGHLLAVICCVQEEQSGNVSLCIHQVASFTDDDVTQPAQTLSLQRRSPYAVHSVLGLLFIGMVVLCERKANGKGNI